MQKNIFTIILFLGYSCLSAQFKYPTKEEANYVKTKKLAIELLSETTQTDSILNSALKDVFSKNWDNSTSVEFLSSAEMNKMVKAKNKNYVYLFQNKEKTNDTRTRSNYLNNFGVRTTNPVYSGIEVRSNYVAFSFNYFAFSLKKFYGNKLAPITRICFANSDVSKSDYLFLEQQLDRLLKYSLAGKSSSIYYGSLEENATKIKNSELLILKDYFKEKDLKKMGSYYKNQFKIVDLNEQEKNILDKTKDKIYLKILWNDFLDVYIWVTIDAESGRVLSQTSFGGVKFGVVHNANEIIKAKHLKYSTSKLFQKVNSRNYR